MQPYSKVLALLGTQDENSRHQADALALAVLQMGSQLALDVSGNPVDALLADMRSRGINENSRNILSARLNPLREQLAKGQA